MQSHIHSKKEMNATVSKKLCIRNTIYAGVKGKDRQCQSLSEYPIYLSLSLAISFSTEFSLLSIYILASLLASTLENVL